MASCSKFVLLIPYFGKFPRFLPLFLESCAWNTEVDFIFFTDIEDDCLSRYVDKAEGNLRRIPMSLREFELLASQKLGQPISLPHPYKICDLKPMLGCILSDFIAQYEFWGCTDIDLIFGDIRQFITDDVLDAHDVISVRSEYLTAFFFLFRNTEKINHLFSNSPDLEKVLHSSQNMNFAECSFAWGQLIAGQPIESLQTEIVSIEHLIRAASRRGDLRSLYADFVAEWIGSEAFHWTRGKLSDGQKDYLLLHFVILKDWLSFGLPPWKVAPEEYFVTRHGFFLPEQIQSRLRYWMALDTRTIVRKAIRRAKHRLRFG